MSNCCISARCFSSSIDCDWLPLPSMMRWTVASIFSGTNDQHFTFPGLDSASGKCRSICKHW